VSRSFSAAALGSVAWTVTPAGTRWWTTVWWTGFWLTFLTTIWKAAG
jgi:hypothetical protein